MEMHCGNRLRRLPRFLKLLLLLFVVMRSAGGRKGCGGGAGGPEATSVNNVVTDPGSVYSFNLAAGPQDVGRDLQQLQRGLFACFCCRIIHFGF